MFRVIARSSLLFAVALAACAPAEVEVERIVDDVEEGLPAPVELEDPSPEELDEIDAQDDVEPEPTTPEPVTPTPEPPAPTPPANCPRVQVVNTNGLTLRVRPDASTSGAPLAEIAPGAAVDVVQAVSGENINGNTTWYQVRATSSVEGFVSGAFTRCLDPNAPYQPGFFLPLACGQSVTISQGPNSSFSHNGQSAWALDFGIARGTPLLAMDDGFVVAAYGGTRPGHPCWSGGGQSCINDANYIVVQHNDGSQSLYAHLDEPSARVGQVVVRGQQVGLSGGTGWSTGPHAHVARQQSCGRTFCQTIPTTFADVGAPATGARVTSGNCD